MATPDADTGPKRLGDFEIIREIGHGGMGVVYEAHQVSLNRRVALKVLSTGLGLTAKAVMRFKREAEAAAKLHHTNIVPVYFIGEENRVPYYVMEIVDGPSLDHIIRMIRNDRSRDPGTGPHQTSDNCNESSSQVPAWVAATILHQGSPNNENATPIAQAKTEFDCSTLIGSGTAFFDNAARMIAEVADALSHAHDQGVIHRDIKPSNILLSPGGQLSVNDFGLARMLEQPGMTVSGEFMGSPLYMSPEQITAGRAPLDHRTDIYSLGATLYELLTLKPPFPGDQRDQVIAQILYKEAMPPRRLNKKIPADLETICLKAMDRDPDRRYQNAGDMAEDLRRFVNRFAISAKRVGPVARTIKWIRRRPFVSLLLGLLFVTAMLAATFGYMVHQQREDHRRQRVDGIKERTLLAGWAGEFDEARNLLKEAKGLGLHLGEAHLMQGQILLLEGRHQDAIFEIELALNELDRNVPAYAMLAIAYGRNGNEDIHLRMLNELKNLPCREFDDYLFKGWAETQWMTRQPILDLEEACRQRPLSQAAALLHAHALRAEAEFIVEPQASLDTVIKAIEQLKAVRAFLPDNARVLAELVLAYLVAADRHQELGDSRRSQKCLELARKDVAELADATKSNDVRYARLMYFFRTGQDEMGLSDFRLAMEDRGSIDSSYAVLCANIFQRKGDIANALKAYKATDSQFKRMGRFVDAYIKLDRALTEDDRSALTKEYTDWLVSVRNDTSGLYGIFDWTVLRLLGEKDEARTIATKWKKACDIAPEPEQWKKMADYMQGTCSDDELLKACSNQRNYMAHAHFLIAIEQLGLGNRIEAAEHLQAALKTDSFRAYAYWWSRVFLERLQGENEWLPWLKPRDPDAEFE